MVNISTPDSSHFTAKNLIPEYVIGAPSADTLEFASHSSHLACHPKRPVVDFGLPPMSPEQKLDTILNILCEAWKSLIDLLLYVLDPSHLDHEFYHCRLYEDGDKLSRMLDFIVAHPSGHETFARLPHALDTVCRKVSQEMDMLTKIDSGGPKSIKELTPDYLWNWSLRTAIAKPAKAKAPLLLSVLQAAISTNLA